MKKNVQPQQLVAPVEEHSHPARIVSVFCLLLVFVTHFPVVFKLASFLSTLFSSSVIVCHTHVELNCAVDCCASLLGHGCHLWFAFPDYLL